MEKPIKQQFDLISKKYDAQRPKLIPPYQDFYTICLPLLDRLPHVKKVLDIGAGTGLFSQFIYQKRPDLDFTLIDISGEMLSVAKERFLNLPNVRFKELDFSTDFITEKYDLIISGLAIHHLEDAQKQRLYQNIHNALHNGGMFINADQVEGRSPWFDEYYKSQWKRIVTASGLDEEALNSAYERMKLDRFAPLEKQLVWLDQAGFTEVDCIYKYQNFVVFAGIKN